MTQERGQTKSEQRSSQDTGPSTFTSKGGRRGAGDTPHHNEKTIKQETSEMYTPNIMCILFGF